MAKRKKILRYKVWVALSLEQKEFMPFHIRKSAQQYVNDAKGFDVSMKVYKAEIKIEI